MSLFNVRLGWWLPNPGPDFRSVWNREEPIVGLYQIVAEAFGRTTHNRSFVYLSDGGHFENLGLYEMVRRRCRRIVLVDATSDPAFEYADLVDAVRKIRVDLGISVSFPEGLPNSESARKSGSHIAIGTVKYSDVDSSNNVAVPDGEIIYIKPLLTGDEPLDVLHYATASRKARSLFPHQSTSDQFFNEAQFESYRMLGLHSVITAYAGTRRHVPIDPTHQPAPTPEWAEPPAGIVKSLARGFESMSSLGKIVTVMAAGGTVLVGGSLTLKNTELSVSKTDRERIDLVVKSVEAAASRLDQLSNRIVSDSAERSSNGHSAAGMSRSLGAAIDKLADRIMAPPIPKVPDTRPPPMFEVHKLPATVLFDSGKSVLLPNGKSALDTLHSSLKDVDIEVAVAVGHTDDVGKVAFNQVLSEARAKAVRNYLVQQGIRRDRIFIEGRGLSMPIVPNNTPDNRQLNRRVEIEVIGVRPTVPPPVVAR